MDIFLLFKKYANIYKLDECEIEELWSIIKPLCKHEELIKRMKKPFYHHDDKMLGEHLFCDTIVTFKLAKKKKNVNVKIACLVAMFHDLYEEPWQNNPKKKKFFNRHGYVHPIEAAINAITWYPNYFEDMNEAGIIIDGIIHHMYPFPVRVIDNSDLSLNNQDKYDKLDDKYKEMIQKATKRGKVGKISFSKSKYKEGRVLSKADKRVSLNLELHSMPGLMALVSGKNKRIKNKDSNK